MTAEELLGLKLFDDVDKGNCAACHPSQPGPESEAPLFTDFTYDNLGFPRNPKNPWYTMGAEFNPEGKQWVDQGLAEFLAQVPRFADQSPDNQGKHKVPTLRNVDKRPQPGFVKAYGHNGYFKTLKDVVHFYNVRDRLPRCGEVENPEPGRNCWPAPEVAANVNQAELGNLGLSEAEKWALVAFMKTLSDGWQPQEK